MYLNRLTLIGFLGRDAEPKQTTGGTPYTLVSIATEESWKDRESGEWKKRIEWHRCICWGKLGEAEANLKKGAHIEIEGQLRSREYAKDGLTRKVWELRADSFLKLDRAHRAEPTEVEQAGEASDTPF
jgi:single-strand DNA-binding protein